MTLKKICLLIIGCIALGLGSAGAFLPLIPTVPFYLLAVFCFARSSKRVHDWFVDTSIYKKHLEDYVKGQGMTANTKVKIMLTITVSMGIGFYFMDHVPVARGIIAVIWCGLMIYFGIICKTKKKGE